MASSKTRNYLEALLAAEAADRINVKVWRDFADCSPREMNS